ncbi:MAG: MMPL family transporter, partial [Eubacterium sp.]|nr:MMPL family transporter [Eubacterium sp.]
MIKIATFIVDRRNLFYLLFILGLVFCIFSMNWTVVENDLSYYLDDSTETKQALEVMDKEFTTYGSAKFMVANLSYEQAVELEKKINKLPYVSMVTFDDSKSHFNEASALYDVTFAYPESDDKCLEALDSLKEELSDYDFYVSTMLGNATKDIIEKEMVVIIAVVAVVVVLVMLFTSGTWAEVPVLLISFVVSILLNKGTNFVFDKISFVSNSVTAVLQLALSIDYAVILVNRFKEERQNFDAREAAIISLSKAIPEIFSSSLTTVGGLVAMIFMQYKIGGDMGIILIKAIGLSLLTCFTLMPGLLLSFSKLMDKTKHKNYVPKISFVGKFAYATRKIIPPVFLVAIVAGFILSGKCPYVYGYSKLETPIINEIDAAKNRINETFGVENMVALVIPSGNYEKEKKLLNELESRSEVDHTMGLPNIEAIDGYMLTDRLTSRQFSELIGLDYEVAQLLYALYAVEDKDYAKVINGLSNYSIALIDVLDFVHKQVDEGYVTLDEDLKKTLDDAYFKISIARKQLDGKKFSRALVYLNLDEEGAETFAFIDEMHDIARKYYGEDAKVYVAGNATSQYDLKNSFDRDNLMVSILSIVIVLAVLLFTFKSAGMPVLLILVIQGAIWINFSFPYLQETNIFFMCYLIVSSIQMGANIDYAIVISNRYMELRETEDKRSAIIDTMNQEFPTIITSGLVMVIAGFSIGLMTSDGCVSGIGQCLGRGTVISLILVMFVLPQILIIGEKIIRKTSFEMSNPIENIHTQNRLQINGPLNGYVNGTVKAVVRGVIYGEVNAMVNTKKIERDDTEDGDGGTPPD